LEDLIVVLLGAMLVAVAVAVAIMVAVVLAATSAAVAAIWAFGSALGVFTGVFAESVAARGGERREPREPEPAFELYVLSQLFADFIHAGKAAGEALAKVRLNIAALADRWSEGPTLPLSIGALLGGYVGTAIAALGGAIAGCVVGIVVLLTSGAAWLLIWMLRLADALRRRVRHASYECPIDHERFSLPVYVCPACSAEHERLVPGRWGIFKRECACGETALPTTVLRGRQRVPQQCPSGHPMSGFLGFAENLPVALVGGPSAGKSTFLAGALLELEDPACGVSVEVLADSREAYSRLMGRMRQGVTPEKTQEERAPALVAEVQGSGRARALYAYDVSGEVYSAADKVRGLRFLARSAGLVLLVDPFAIPTVAQEHAADLARLTDRILPSSEDPMRVYERLLLTLSEAGVNLATVPLAVVIAKADACGIEQEIARLGEADGPNPAARAWLKSNGAGNLVRAVEQSFKCVGWFSCSALGRIPTPTDSRAFAPRGVLAPLLWVLEQRDIRPASAGANASHTAQQLVGTAADFPPATPAVLARRATLGALAGLASLAAVVVLLVGTLGSGPSSQAATADALGGASGSTAAGYTQPAGAGVTAHATPERVVVGEVAKLLALSKRGIKLANGHPAAAVHNRTEVLRRLRALAGHTKLLGPELRALRRAIEISKIDDKRIIACGGNPNIACFKATNDRANAAKRRFVALFNPYAQKYLGRRYKRADF
jgi:Double-GTPase 2